MGSKEKNELFKTKSTESGNEEFEEKNRTKQNRKLEKLESHRIFSAVMKNVRDRKSYFQKQKLIPNRSENG